tara:strand:- start:1239 stop:1757 length:519 start_codon:yes stop_codon:yes gene_type:complete
MKKYEAVIILNPNLSSKVESFIADFKKLLKDNNFNSLKCEDVGRRQLAYSINNHNKGHYLIFNLEGEPTSLIDIENKIKYNESIIRHLFIVVKNHLGEDSQLLVDSKNKKDHDDNADDKLVEKASKDIKKQETEKESVQTDESVKPEPEDAESKVIDNKENQENTKEEDSNE